MKDLFILLALTTSLAVGRHVEVFVCLCDNEHQAIAPVGKAIGNGLDPAGNLYWGCTDGLSTYFKKCEKWKLVETIKPKECDILVTLKFKHHTGNTTLTAHAYRGDRMRDCLEEFYARTRDSGKEDLVAFIGHNGMMDNIVTIPKKAAENDEASSAIVLGCLSQGHFTGPLKKMNSNPLLLTRSLMYPGSFVLHEAIEIWLKDGSKTQIREAAAKAYAKNQKISIKGASTVFADLGK